MGELTVGYKSNLRSNAKRKKKHRELVQQLKKDNNKVNFINLLISTWGMYDKSTNDFIHMMKCKTWTKGPKITSVRE